MSQSAAPNSQAEADRLEDAAADQAIAACGGDVRAALKALIVANEFLEAQISQGYMRGVKHGRFKTYNG
jgi:hypothetical protein